MGLIFAHLKQIRINYWRPVLLFCALLCSASMCVYWSRTARAIHSLGVSSSVSRPQPLTDFYPSWYATRERLLHNRDPYGADVNRELQIAYYGKELDGSRPEKTRDQQRFVYPAYFLFFVAPTAEMDFHTARIVVWWVLAFCAVLNFVLWIRFVPLPISMIGRTALLALFLGSIPVIQNLGILQPFLLPSCFIAGTAAALISGRLYWAGSLLALATLKPQICFPLLVWFALWTSGDWHRRRSLVWGFGVTLATLVVSSEWLVPTWIVRYPGVLRAYAEYTKTTSFLGMLLPAPLNWPVALVLLGIVARFCLQVRRQPADSIAFAVALSLVLTLTVILVPAVVQPYNHVLLLPVVLLAIRHWREVRKLSFVNRIATSFFALCAFLPWIFALVALAKPLNSTRNWWPEVPLLPILSSMALPFAAFGFLMMVSHIVRNRLQRLEIHGGTLPPNLPAASEG